MNTPTSDRVSRLMEWGGPNITAASPAGRYARFALEGDLAYSSGVVGRHGGRIIPGPLNGHDDVPHGEQAATAAAASILWAAHEEFGGLGQIAKVVSLQGYLCVAASFTEHGRVMDAASRLIQRLFPDAPLPARTTVGVASLPGVGAVEVSMVLQLCPTCRPKDIQ